MAKTQDGQQLLDLPLGPKILFTILGILLMGVGVYAIGNHLFTEGTPSPADMEASFLIGMGIVTLFGAYFPWMKLKFGDFEVERAVQDQADDYHEEIERLKGIINAYEEEVTKENAAPVNLKQTFAKHKEEISQETKDKEIISNLLKKYPSYGFNTTRIQNFETGFNSRSDISLSKIRILANELVNEGKAKTRISKNGNMLYQAR